jgi:hypothetical protein
VTLDIYRHVLDSEKKTAMPKLFDTPLPIRQIHAGPPNQKRGYTRVTHEH